MDNYITEIVLGLITPSIIALVKMGMTIRDLKGQLAVVDERLNGHDLRLNAGGEKMKEAAQSVFAIANRVTYLEAKTGIQPPTFGS